VGSQRVDWGRCVLVVHRRGCGGFKSGEGHYTGGSSTAFEKRRKTLLFVERKRKGGCPFCDRERRGGRFIPSFSST